MTVRSILQYPDKRLRIAGKKVTNFGPELQKLVADMAETMYAAPGVGLAAPQIGESYQLFIVDVAVGDEEPSDLRVFINPKIVHGEGEVAFEEGCLSFPGAREEVLRKERVKVVAQNEYGESFELETDGLLAIAIQHENDHLNGRLMIDHLSPLRRRLLHRAMAKRSPAIQAAQ
ncbi:MAG: peptide deformylase [Myxococcales bacterium]|nr:MAG: peptide deformylase [Myxococcales bacterium]